MCGGRIPFPRQRIRCCVANIKALEETRSLLREDVFQRVIEIFHEAPRICFFGVGTSMSTAMKAAEKFLKIEPKVYAVEDSHVQAMMASTMKEGEAAVIFSYPVPPRIPFMRRVWQRTRGAVIICVTRL